jgi:hypothetical protein
VKGAAAAKAVEMGGTLGGREEVWEEGLECDGEVNSVESEEDRCSC